VRGGQDGVRCQHWKVGANGDAEELPSVVGVRLSKGEIVMGNQSSGGGYGSPLEREPRRVLRDVLEGFETPDRARDVYGVVLGLNETDEHQIDVEGTVALRRQMAAGMVAG
jgi:N-methylhydantoinase B